MDDVLADPGEVSNDMSWGDPMSLEETGVRVMELAGDCWGWSPWRMELWRESACRMEPRADLSASSSIPVT